tara:strand:- start:1020 stop:1193 length:174 start_codon:yes stop_codon:yes gene_type:complete
MEKLLLAYMVNSGYGSHEQCAAHIKQHGFDNVAKALGKVETYLAAHPSNTKRKEVSS